MYDKKLDEIISKDPSKKYLKELADRGIDVFMYDHTIDSLPYENNHFHWKKIGICGKSSSENNLKTLGYVCHA